MELPPRPAADVAAGIPVSAWSAPLVLPTYEVPLPDPHPMFLEKRVFEEIGGFAPLPIMEDFDLVRRLRRRGPVVTLEEPILTSARRWRRLGIVRTAFRNQCMIAGYLAGVKPERLHRFYYGKEPGPPG